MGSFASELGVQFDACMEAPHVIDADSQVHLLQVGSASEHCMTERKLNFSSFSFVVMTVDRNF